MHSSWHADPIVNCDVYWKYPRFYRIKTVGVIFFFFFWKLVREIWRYENVQVLKYIKLLSEEYNRKKRIISCNAIITEITIFLFNFAQVDSFLLSSCIDFSICSTGIIRFDRRNFSDRPEATWRDARIQGTRQGYNRERLRAILMTLIAIVKTNDVLLKLGSKRNFEWREDVFNKELILLLIKYY